MLKSSRQRLKYKILLRKHGKSLQQKHNKKRIKILKFKNWIQKFKKLDELKMPIFLQPNDEEIPNETAKFIAKTQSHMNTNQILSVIHVI